MLVAEREISYITASMMKSMSTDEPQTVSPGKRRIFWFILVISPLLFLLLAELVLRVFDYGGNLSLVVTKEVMGKEYYTLNHDIARRYFSQPHISLPEPYDDIFEVQKGPMTKRIFMLGESTMAGFPYDYTATAPLLLKNRLERLLPQFHFEVINAALSAVNSYTVVDFMKELVRYQPDAFVVYVGHNEFYGALGVGSTESLGKSGTFIRFYLGLENIRLFRLLRDGLVRFRGLFHREEIPTDASLMEALAGSQTIPYHGDDYREALYNFGENLRRMIAICSDRHVPLVLSTLTSNIRDQEPLSPLFSPDVTQDEQESYDRAISLARSDIREGNFLQAERDCDSAMMIDSMNATAHFMKGKCLDARQEYREAKHEYGLARDYDGLRFRASAEFNTLIRTLARSAGLPLADADSAFDRSSRDGIVGNNLMLEHLHPNFDGYLLLAKTFLRTIADHHLLADQAGWHWSNDLTDEAYKRDAGVTEFDLEAGRCKIQTLTSRWPFRREGTSAWHYQPRNLVQRIVQQYIQKKLSWSSAHYSLADSFHVLGEDSLALLEYHAVSKVQPYYYYPLMLAGDIYRTENRDSLAEVYYERGLQLQDSPFLHVRLGMLHYTQNNFPQALKDFQMVFSSEEKSSEKMDVKSRSLAYYFLGVTYGKQGDLLTAKSNLQLAQELDPTNKEIQSLLSQFK